MNDDVVKFFSRSTHCTPEVIHNIVLDIDTLCGALKAYRKCVGFGILEQPKLCIYGGLPLEFCVTTNNKISINVPFQIWLSHEYPIEPPNIFLLAPQCPESFFINSIESINKFISDDGKSLLQPVYSTDSKMNSCLRCESQPFVNVICYEHPNIDVTGLCYCSELARWHPTYSSLCNVIQCLGHEIEKSKKLPMCYFSYISNTKEENKECLLSNNHPFELNKENVRDEFILSQTTEFKEAQQPIRRLSQSYDMYKPNMALIDMRESKTVKCVICYERSNVVLVPCGHYCLCVSCASSVEECPMCRSRIKVRQRVIETF